MAKRQKINQRQRSMSPYQRYKKREYDYSAMYARNPHLAERRRIAAANALSKSGRMAA